MLDLLGGCEVERIFPVDTRYEERTRRAELHLWYAVRFGKEFTVDEVISLAEYGKEVQLEVKNHRIAFISSDCPDKVCIHNGWLSREGEQAICLPNRVSVTLTDGSTVPVELN